MRVAVIGLGGVAERIHLPALAKVDGIQIVGACEPDAARREAVGRKFAIADLYPDAESMLSAARADIVVIGSPPDAHHAQCLLALASGAHVFCEKPFVERPEQ